MCLASSVNSTRSSLSLSLSPSQLYILFFFMFQTRTLTSFSVLALLLRYVRLVYFFLTLSFFSLLFHRLDTHPCFTSHVRSDKFRLSTVTFLPITTFFFFLCSLVYPPLSSIFGSVSPPLQDLLNLFCILLLLNLVSTLFSLLFSGWVQIILFFYSL